MRSLGALERIGAWCAMPPGVVMVEATKQVRATVPIKKERVRVLRPSMVGKAAPSHREPAGAME